MNFVFIPGPQPHLYQFDITVSIANNNFQME